MMATCSTATNQDGIQPVGVCPWYLHGNSTPHTWIFGAFAELIDNAYDPDVNAEEFWIDKVDYEGSPCLMFKDNGSGISPDKFLKMFSFGYCEKRRDESYPNHMPIGQYGNGFKSGTMRMGEDAIVFTRTKDSASVGFLSKTYLEAIGSDNLIVPIVHYSLPGMQRCEPRKFENNLKAILTYSVFHSEDALKEELLELETCGTGTKIIISNLKKINNDLLELDFTSDPTDILCPAAQEVEASAVKSRSCTINPSRYRVSLREYCTILFLKPRMIIHIRGKKVRTKLVSRALREPCYFNYKPHTVKSPIRVTFGFTWGQMETEDYGMMLYNRNRLIKAFERVGCQRQSNTTDGIGVVGVAEINFVEPEHTKQNFTSSTAYNAALRWFGDKLNEYWYEKKYTGTPGQSRQQRGPNWVQCCKCSKWRRLSGYINPDKLPDEWCCSLNPDPDHNRCEFPEEQHDVDIVVKPTKTKRPKISKNRGESSPPGENSCDLDMSINTDIERDGLNSCPEKTQPEMTDHNQTTKRKPTAEFSIAESPKKLCTRVDPEKLGKSQTSDQTPVMVANNPDETSGHGGSELPHTSSMEENTALMNVNIGPKIRAQLQEPCSPGDANLASTSTATMNHLGVDSVPKKMNGTAADSQIKVGSAQKPIKSGSKKTTSEAYVQTEINARQLMLEMNEMKSINAALRQEIDELKNRMYKFVSILDPNSDLGEVNDIGKLVLSMIKNQEESDEMP